MDEPATKSTAELMQEFSLHASPEAFTSLVERYLPVVYGAALRRCGDPTLAEDVSQLVFSDFATRAPSLRADNRIGAWLHRAAMLTTGDLLKSERRRKKREQLAAELMELDRLPDSNAWTELRPVIDESINQLRARDREAIILRCYEGRSLRQVGATFGVSEDAAQKRVERALSRLRAVLVKSGLTLGVAMLGSTLAEQAGATAISSTLAGKISTAALHKLSAGGLSAWWFRHGLVPQYAFTAAAIAFIASAVPLLGKWGQALETPAVRAEVGEQASLVPAVESESQPIDLEQTQTLEEIIDALGALLAQPPTALDRARCSVLFSRIPETQAGRAFALMDQSWPGTTMRRAERANPNWSYRLFNNWGLHEPEAAIAWVLNNTEFGAPLYLERSHWLSRISSVIQKWSERDWEAAWAWALSGIEDGSLLVKDDRIDVTKSTIDGLREQLVEHAGLEAALDFMVTLQSPSGLGVLMREVKTFDDFVLFMEFATKIRSPEDRHNLRRQMAYQCPPTCRPAVLDWIKARPSPMERAELAWALGFPRLTDEIDPGAIPLDDFTAHADWMLSIDPNLSQYNRSKAFRDLTYRWMRYDPKAAVDWILANDFFSLGTTMMNNILGSIPTEQERIYRTGPLAPDDEWKAQAARLLIKARELDPNLYKSVVLERSPGRRSIEQTVIDEFLDAYGLGEVTE